MPEVPVRLLGSAAVAEIFHVNAMTVTRWEKKDLIVCVRTPGGHRRYREDHIRSFFGALWTDAAAEPPALITLQEMASAWTVGERQVKRWIAAGKMPAIRTPGGRHRLLAADAPAGAVLKTARSFAGGEELCPSAPRTGIATRRTGRRSVPGSGSAGRSAGASARANADAVRTRAAAPTATGSLLTAPAPRWFSPALILITPRKTAIRTIFAECVKPATTPMTHRIALKHGGASAQEF